MTVHVRLDELDQDGAILTLGEHGAAALERTGLVEVRPRGRGRWQLLPRGYVGAVRFGNLQIQVDPKEKVGLSRLLFMLGYANDPGFRPEDVEGLDAPDLWPALAETLARLVERALARGVLQGYRSIEESLRTVRGRIRIGDQIRLRPGLMMPLEVTYDDYTVDTAENRILRSALRRMLAVPRLPVAVTSRLRHLDARLEGVSLIPPGSRVPQWTPTRLNMRYQPALRLSEIVLRNASAETGTGGVPMASFVVPMWRVFEEFVATALSEALRARPGRTVTQYPSRLDEPRRRQLQVAVTMAVDIVHLDEAGRPRIVFDAKYKVASSGGQYPNADHYQMLAYCTALHVPVAWLVYAQGRGEVTARRIRNTGITIMEYPLDLTVAPQVLLDQVGRLAAMAHGQTPSPARHVGRAGTLASRVSAG